MKTGLWVVTLSAVAAFVLSPVVSHAGPHGQGGGQGGNGGRHHGNGGGHHKGLKNHDPIVDKREHRQRSRIQEGVKSGELTKDEAHSLRTEQRAIRAEEKSYKSDGHLSRKERTDLYKDQNEASRDIRSEKHDNDVRSQ